MKRTIVVVLAAALFVPSMSCSKKGEGKAAAMGADAEKVAATVNGVAITMREVDKAAEGQLKKVETEIYQIRKRALDDLIEEKLIEQEAKKKGLSAERFLAQEVDAKVSAPTEEEVKSLYDSNKDRVGKPFEELKGEITDYLTKNRKARARADLIASLKRDASIKIELEPPRVKIDTSGAPSVGDGKLEIVEFSDYQCPFCKRVRPTIWRLVDEYKGKIKYYFMDFPLSFHKDARKAHEAAHCAGDQGKYFEFNRKIFDNQTKIGVADLKKYAKELNLKQGEFDKCLDSGKHAKLVDEMIRRGTEAGVSGTPAYFINGVMLSGAQPYESFKELIDQELAR